MTTLLQFRTLIRDRLDEPTARFWTDTQLNSWINEAAADIARRTETLQDRQTQSVVANTREYSLDANVLRVYRVEYIPTGAGQPTYPLEYRQFNALDSIWHTQSALTTGTPCYFTIWGFSPTNKIILYPTPTRAGTLRVYVYRLPTATTTDGTTIEVPAGWDSLVIDYAEYSALRKDRDPRWSEARSLYESRLADMWDMTRQYSDQMSVITPDVPLGLPQWLVGGDLGYY